MLSKQSHSLARRLHQRPPPGRGVSIQTASFLFRSIPFDEQAVTVRGGMALGSGHGASAVVGTVGLIMLPFILLVAMTRREVCVKGCKFADAVRCPGGQPHPCC